MRHLARHIPHVVSAMLFVCLAAPGVATAAAPATAADPSAFSTPGQTRFALRMAALTGLDVNVVQAWEIAEASGESAQVRERAGNNNWLSIGYYDSLSASDPFQGGNTTWQTPESGAAASAAFLTGKFLAAGNGVQRIPLTAGQSVDAQIDAIASSGWALSGYDRGSSIRTIYRLVPKLPQPSPAQIVS